MLSLGGSPQAKAPEPASQPQPPIAATPIQPQPVAATQQQTVPTTQTVLSLGDVFVPLETIQPGKNMINRSLPIIVQIILCQLQ